ncbi:MAG: hypothetical protein V4555_17525 [Acidobacteriota bacterium]
MWTRFWLKIAGRAALWLVLAALFAYPVDWAVWKIRVGHGGGMGQVEVGHVIAAELKNSREEYFADGMTEVDCSRSLYPQGGYSACWWLERHNDVVTRY